MHNSLPQLHRAQAARFGPRTALRFRQLGCYTQLSWDAYRHAADGIALGLMEFGVVPGDRVGILSENRFEWLITDHAILSSGAADVTMHAPLSAAQVEFQLRDSGACGVFVSHQEQADKVFQVEANLPDLKFLISYEPVQSSSTKLEVVSFEGLKHRGWHGRAGGVASLLDVEADLSRDSLATIIYTSGTTGNPKGVMLTHGNLLSNVEGLDQLASYRPHETMFSWLPYSHVFARTVDHYLTTQTGMTIALADSIESIVPDLKIFEPSWMTAVPRFYEKIWSMVESLDEGTRKHALRNIFGPNMQQLSSGGAPLPMHVCQGFFDAGLPVLEGYGLTESSPVITFNHLQSYRLGSVGQTLPNVDVKIADDGEILTHGPHVMRGYWNNPEATAAAVEDGWLKTGDVGELDADGFLTITDRKKDLFVTSGGKNIAPSVIERALMADPFVEQAVVYGDGRQFLAALIVPNRDVLDPYAKQNGLSWGDCTDFLVSAALDEFFTTRIDAALADFSNPEKVKRFLILARPFELAADELTATLKVRRRHIIEKYETQLSGLYDG